MGNSNELVASYVSEEELNRIRELELREKQKKQKLKIKELDKTFYILAWNLSLYKNGGYGNALYRSPNGKYSILTNIYLVRSLYFWYSNSIC